MRFPWNVLGGSNEKHIIEGGLALISLASEANRMLIDVIKGSNNITAIKEVERKADVEVFEASNAITSGAVAPNLIDDLMRFMDLEEGIVDTIFNLSRAIARYRPQNRSVRRYLTSMLLELSSLIEEELSLLYKMHQVTTIAEAAEIRKKIEHLEQKGDLIKDAMIDYAYKSKSTDFKSFYYVQNVAYLADDIMDGCEDTSDMILSIMRSILT